MAAARIAILKDIGGGEPGNAPAASGSAIDLIRA